MSDMLSVVIIFKTLRNSALNYRLLSVLKYLMKLVLLNAYLNVLFVFSFTIKIIQ